MTQVVPFLRVRDAEKSAEWYRRLGFEAEWRHRFAPDLPLFLAVRRDGARIFLSEHTGDAPPNGLLYIYVSDLDEVARAFARTVERTEYGMDEIELVDPDGNRIRVGSPPLD